MVRIESIFGRFCQISPLEKCESFLWRGEKSFTTYTLILYVLVPASTPGPGQCTCGGLQPGGPGGLGYYSGQGRYLSMGPGTLGGPLYGPGGLGGYGALGPDTTPPCARCGYGVRPGGVYSPTAAAGLNRYGTLPPDPNCPGFLGPYCAGALEPAAVDVPMAAPMAAAGMEEDDGKHVFSIVFAKLMECFNHPGKSVFPLRRRSRCAQSARLSY